MSDDAPAGPHDEARTPAEPDQSPPAGAPPAPADGGRGVPQAPGAPGSAGPLPAAGADWPPASPPALAGGSSGSGAPSVVWFSPTSPPPARPAPAPGVTAGPAEEPVELIESLATIWTEPRATIRRIVAVDPGFWVNRIAALTGVVFAIAFWNGAADAGLTGGEAGVIGPAGLIVTVLLWPPLMILGLYFSAWLTRITGAWLLDGKADARAIRTALAWSYIPLLALLPLALLAPVLARVSAGGGFAATALLLVFGLLYFTATIWCLVIQCQGVAEVQGFRSAWQGLLNVLLPGLLVLAVAIVLLIVIGVIGGLAGLGR